jgi:hypothetical protein
MKFSWNDCVGIPEVCSSLNTAESAAALILVCNITEIVSVSERFRTSLTITLIRMSYSVVHFVMMFIETLYISGRSPL